MKDRPNLSVNTVRAVEGPSGTADADRTPGLFGSGQRPVECHQFGQSLLNVVRKRARPALGEVHVQQHLLTGRSQVALMRMVHVKEVMDAFGIEIQ